MQRKRGEERRGEELKRKDRTWYFNDRHAIAATSEKVEFTQHCHICGKKNRVDGYNDVCLLLSICAQSKFK